MKNTHLFLITERRKNIKYKISGDFFFLIFLIIFLFLEQARRCEKFDEYCLIKKWESYWINFRWLWGRVLVLIEYLLSCNVVGAFLMDQETPFDILFDYLTTQGWFSYQINETAAHPQFYYYKTLKTLSHMSFNSFDSAVWCEWN
jgi:hypothetical protein